MKINVIKSERTVYFIFGIITMLIGSLVIFYLNQGLLQYNFSAIHKRVNSYPSKFFETEHFVDLNNDGESEKIVIGYEDDMKNYFFQILSMNGKVWEQFNFGSYSLFSKDICRSGRFSFEDYNNDGLKDIFVISALDYSLFLNIISTTELKFVLKKRKIFQRKNFRKDRLWDVNTVQGALIDINNDGYKDFLMSFNTGYALYPRGFLSYDIKNDKILNSFFVKTSFNFKIFDIDKDGQEEILATSSAGGNTPISDTTGFHDYTSWFIIFNKNLEFKFPPKRYGGFRTGANFIILEDSTEIRILHYAIYGGNDFDVIFTYFAYDGKEIEKKIIKCNVNSHINSFYIDGKPFFIQCRIDGIIKIFDQEINEIKMQKSGSDDNESFLKAVDLTNDGIVELIFQADDKFIVRDLDLQKIAEIEINEEKLSPEIVEFGIGKQNGISIQTKQSSIIYKLEPSLLNKYFYLFSIFIYTIIYLIFIISYLFIKKISILFKTFLFFINENDSALLLLNQNGKILNFNKRFKEIFYNDNLKKGAKFNQILDEESEVFEILSNAIKEQNPITSNVNFYYGDKLFKGKIEVNQFRASLGYTFGYLVKLIDQTESILTERLKVWTHTAQKIAHEIKTPLSSIKLNLKTLKKRLENESIQKMSDINDDIDTINQQVNRIKVQTSSLLKITNLEKTSIGDYSLFELVNLSLEKFTGYFTDGINIKIDDSLKNTKILFDKNQFIEIVQIIIENSIDALKGKGEIEIKVVDSSENDFIKLEIKDYGCGIDSKNLNNIFEPYFTNKKEGTGLGLAFAKKIMNDSQSKIEIKSSKNNWTSVFLTFPTKTN